MGHEFTSLILALLQVSGYAPKVAPELLEQIKGLQVSDHFDVFVSLSCHNCPDVVQALNLIAIYNPNATATMIDGAFFQDEVEERKIMAVPMVFQNGQHIGQGRMTLEEIIAKLDNNSAEKTLRPSMPKLPLMCWWSVLALRVEPRPFMPHVKAFVPV